MNNQPGDFSIWTTENDPLDLDRNLFLPDDFFDSYDDLCLGHGDRTLTTPTIVINNLWNLPELEPVFDINKELQEPSGNSTDEIEMSLMDISENVVNENDSTQEMYTQEQQDIAAIENDVNESDSAQKMHTQEQEDIAAIENDLKNAMNEIISKMDLQAIVDAIYRHLNPTMRVLVEPLAQHRFRYRSDGIRYLEQSRINPMSIEFPILQGCITKAGYSFWIQFTIITTQQNPKNKVFAHQHEIIYNGENAIQVGRGCVRILVTEDEIRQRIKTFRYLSIIKTKHGDYTFELVPYDPLMVDDHVEMFTLPNENVKTKAYKAKKFDEIYHLDTYQISAQLMIRQHDAWYATAIHCETHVITDMN